MVELELILLLLASSRYLVHPIDGATRNEKPAAEETRSQNNVLSSVAASAKNVLAQTGGSAMLPCRFTGPGIVTWSRRRDRQLLTVGRHTHSIEDRFVVVPDSPDWNLKIKNVKKEDAGLYECQIQTDPIQKRLIQLSITDAYSMIPGGPNLHVKQGSSLRLECQLMASAEAPSFIFWYRQGRMINYDNEPGVTVEATKNGSILTVDKVKTSHGANYTCLPSNARAAYIMIHVIEEEEKPAAMHGGDRRNSTRRASINVMLIFLSFLGVQCTGRLCLHHSRVT
ncbi:limbic system-associated membrane protein [Megalopta genalis]|uniref:limbic system-associated membrane protein n=1 Tax=Megalopta genalis TaxID=115081 RepID=UPI001442FCD4|nr:Down syndrome cell adhesion molecule-like protein 1 homolog [Megalopta genalis]XP_033334936.1 Down syndrome cell adhesion molecule-like protein 1 homolog [Megalopta genalis]XP_033334945.1 Down syndrome cell adhesion molecule-like protein 1 homolog [Megalopta genalis]XP_033334954.1 Down syndrome cell adhesion molecule-like protein 1 homolog [Megalopta genalis]XP_033334963.1 Down syndrome cell adhesion molecule-like protein 1 homolog [Megalopta genalis]